LTLIIAVAAFNLVSSLVMAVNEKRADIAILRTLGATPSSIRQIFLVQGVVTGCIGTVLGVAGGALVAFNIDVILPAIEHALGFQFRFCDGQSTGSTSGGRVSASWRATSVARCRSASLSRTPLTSPPKR
ncbi:MAG: FtsX-like permease family protein, partial [Betaproteobacteria bacterium]|nr:FtsX-like permease family protein [Betaproteobacteria bacterium]